MAYPSLEQYNQAFSAHSTLLVDPELRAGTLAKSGLGLPHAISGGFAFTYTISGTRGKFAVRCFHRESKGLEKRYAAISKKLTSLRSPYFLNFEFQEKGIRVDGAAYPIVKMAWASGTTLGEFLEDNLRNSAALGKLADSITQLAEYLKKEGIAHGDLQSGNLMVGRDGSSVQLIDYDGLFVDEIRNLGSAELGHINFQHPQRKSINPFDATLDRFSLIALSLSIRAIQADPTLWSKTNSDADAILFRYNDFLDPARSSAFALVAKNPKPYIFINFGPWQGRIFKVSIWSDGLAHVKAKPDASWVGKWVSVVGLMEPPYESKKYRYSHLSITAGPAGTLIPITEQEAQWRLAGAGKTAGVFSATTSTSNQQTLDKIRGVSGRAPGNTPSRISSPPISPNTKVVEKIRAASSTSPSTTPSKVKQTTYQQPAQQPSAIERFFKWIFG